MLWKVKKTLIVNASSSYILTGNISNTVLEVFLCLLHKRYAHTHIPYVSYLSACIVRMFFSEWPLAWRCLLFFCFRHQWCTRAPPRRYFPKLMRIDHTARPSSSHSSDSNTTTQRHLFARAKELIIAAIVVSNILHVWMVLTIDCTTHSCPCALIWASFVDTLTLVWGNFNFFTIIFITLNIDT